jgi:hypothetical protein
MSNSTNSALGWMIGLVCVSPLVMFALGYLLATAIHKGWIKVRVDTSAAPKFNGFRK